MTHLPQPPDGELSSQVAELAAALRAARGFPSGPVLDALVLARLVTDAASGAADGPDPLPGLHLDLAAREVADAFGHTQRPPPQVAGTLVDTASRAVVGRLVELCVRTIQSHLELRPTELGAEQLLALTRAVLHLAASRSAWPADAPGGPR